MSFCKIKRIDCPYSLFQYPPIPCFGTEEQCDEIVNLKTTKVVENNTKLEILKWEDKTFDEIPEQDNPSFDYKYDADGFIIGRNNRCLIICKDENSQSKFINIHGRYVVFEVPTKPINAIRIGAFSKIKDAEIFAEALALKENK